MPAIKKLTADIATNEPLVAESSSRPIYAKAAAPFAYQYPALIADTAMPDRGYLSDIEARSERLR